MLRRIADAYWTGYPRSGENGVDVFIDHLSLSPGDKWKPVIENEIRQRESFLLFWSQHAKNSEMVTWEWRTALDFKGIDGIDPHPLVPASEAEPPEELKALHFGDIYMHEMQSSIVGSDEQSPANEPGKPKRPRFLG